MNVKHKMSDSPEYSSWHHMKKRCYYRKDKDYERYSGRGITVCDRWKNSFVNFINDMGLKPFPKAEIDRINNNGNYEPGNCQWANRAQNGRNTITTKLNMKDAFHIRELYKNGNYTHEEIAGMYNVHRETIGCVIRNRTWI